MGFKASHDVEYCLCFLEKCVNLCIFDKVDLKVCIFRTFTDTQKDVKRHSHITCVVS